MKENDTALYPNPEVSQAVTQYSLEHSTELPKHISDYHAWGSTQPKANFMISPFQAQFQIFMARAMGAKRGMLLCILLEDRAGLLCRRGIA